jgi:hypothetical protein
MLHSLGAHALPKLLKYLAMAALALGRNSPRRSRPASKMLPCLAHHTIPMNVGTASRRTLRFLTHRF